MNTKREYWLRMLDQMARPVLTALAQGQLIKTMPVEFSAGHPAPRADCTHLEAFGRLLTGIAPWLELEEGSPFEMEIRHQYRALVKQAMEAGVAPDSPDYLFKKMNHQHLVDSAFLAHGLLRAPTAITPPPAVLEQLIRALKSTRAIRAGSNNWLLFSAMIEAALHHLGQDFDMMRVDYALRQHMQWYKGDGMYGDGPDFHFDYYNSYVIQPMLLQVVEEFAPAYLNDDRLRIENRAVRYAAILERLIMADGTFPAVGRSICYRAGAFHLLADITLRQKLPADLHPAQVRCALSAVIHQTLEAPETYNPEGFLRIGLCGSQPALGENYISTGSLYLSSLVFLPLGLPPENPFWSEPDQPWTQKRIWSGKNETPDHAYIES